MLVKFDDGRNMWSSLKPGILAQALDHGQNGLQYRLAQFSINDVSAPYLWWTQSSHPSSPIDFALDRALKQATMEETVYLFHGTAHVPVRIRSHLVQPDKETGVPLERILEMSLQQRVLSEASDEQLEPDASYFGATAELPGVFVATFAPPPPIFWGIPADSGFVVQNHLDLSITYAQGKRYERYLVDVMKGNTPFSDARALREMIAFRFTRAQAVMEFHEGSHWTPGVNRFASQNVPSEWLRALSLTSE